MHRQVALAALVRSTFTGAWFRRPGRSAIVQSGSGLAVARDSAKRTAGIVRLRRLRLRLSRGLQGVDAIPPGRLDDCPDAVLVREGDPCETVTLGVLGVESCDLAFGFRLLHSSRVDPTAPSVIASLRGNRTKAAVKVAPPLYLC